MSRHSSDYGAAGDWLVGAAKRNPEAFLVLAAGCALLLRGSGNGTHSRTSSGHSDDLGQQFSQGRGRRGGERRQGMSEAVRERVSEVTETAAEYASEIGDRVYDTAASYASAASEYAEEGRRTVTRQASRLGGQARHAADRVLAEQPLAVAALGLAAGAALAALLPSTEMEERTLAPAHDALAGAANRTAERLKEAAGDMGKQIKTSVAERVLSGDIAKEAARAFASSLKGDEDGDAGGGRPR